MVLKNLTVVIGILIVFSGFSFGDEISSDPILPPITADASATVEPVVPVLPSLSEDVSGTIDAPTAGGMDPVVRRIYLSMVAPSDNFLQAENGGFILSSISSYSVNDESLKPISCSFIARKNIGAFVDTLRIFNPSITQGDANDLIRFGKINKTLSSFTDKKAFVDALNTRKTQFFETVFDAYRHVSTRSYAFQGHRAVIFLGDDDQWYILDPLDGEKTLKPQLLETYLTNDVADAEWFARLPGYSPFNILEKERFTTILPFLSSELQLFFDPDYLTRVDEEETNIVTNQYDDRTTSLTSEVSA